MSNQVNIIAIKSMVVIIIIASLFCMACNRQNELQDKLKNIYYDQGKNKISKNKYDNILDFRYNVYVVEESSLYRKHFIIDRFTEGKLTKEELEDFVKQFIPSELAESFNQHGIRIVYYNVIHFEDDFDCLNKTIELEYTKKTERDFLPIQSLHIINPEYLPLNHYQNLIIDDNNFILKSILNNNYVCSNYIYINAKGEYMICMADGCESYRFGL